IANRFEKRLVRNSRLSEPGCPQSRFAPGATITTISRAKVTTVTKMSREEPRPSERVFRRLTTLLATCILIVISFGFCLINDIRIRAIQFRTERDAEIRQIEEKEPGRAAILRDNLQESMTFDVEAAFVYFATIGLAVMLIGLLLCSCFS